MNQSHFSIDRIYTPQLMKKRMAQNSYIYLLSVFVFTSIILTQGGGTDRDTDFDALSTVHEFKIEVLPGRQECFYKKLKEEGKLQVFYQVLRGSDRTIDIFVKDSSKKVILQDLSKSQGVLKMMVQKTGTYEICIDATRGQLVSKLVFLGIYLLLPVTTETMEREIYLHKAVRNLSKLTEQMSEYQVRSRLSLMSDWYLTKGNNVYVMYYSFAQCLVIVLTSCAQVYVLRRFFRTVPVTNSVKSRD